MVLERVIGGFPPRDLRKIGNFTKACDIWIPYISEGLIYVTHICKRGTLQVNICGAYVGILWHKMRNLPVLFPA